MSDNEPALSSLIAIGIVRKPIGLEGLCAVEALGASLKLLQTPITVVVGATEAGATAYQLDGVDMRSKGPVCKFTGIDTAEQAIALRDSFIYIDAGKLPSLQNDAYYHFELIGLRVHTDHGKELGRVVAVHNFPTVDSVEVEVGGGETMMIPLTNDAVIDLDRSSGYLTVNYAFIQDL